LKLDLPELVNVVILNKIQFSVQPNNAFLLLYGIFDALGKKKREEVCCKDKRGKSKPLFRESSRINILIRNTCEKKKKIRREETRKYK